MSSAPTTSELVLADLNKILNQSAGGVPEIGVAYIASNDGLIRFLLSETYENTDEQKRVELAAEHDDLNEMSAPDDFYSHPCSALDATSNWKDNYVPISRDDLQQLIRGIEYAQYCVTAGGFRILLHPIDRYLH